MCVYTWALFHLAIVMAANNTEDSSEKDVEMNAGPNIENEASLRKECKEMLPTHDENVACDKWRTCWINYQKIISKQACIPVY